MAILQKQLEKLIERASYDSLKKGRVLDLDRISQIIKERFSRLDGGPILNVRRHDRRKGVNIPAINEMLEEAHFDINLLYEMIQEKFALILNRFNSTDVSYKAQRAQLNSIDAAVTDLLFSLKNADDNFFGVFDNLSDTTKIDMQATTDGAIDLAEGVALLPFSMPSATRHDLSHLYNVDSGRISIVANENARASGKNGAATKFGNAFSDISTSWRYDVTAATAKGVEVTATFSLNRENAPTVLTRIEVAGIAGSGTRIDLQYSLDDQNYTRFENAQEKLILPNTEKISWDFPETTCRYIRLVFNKAAPDAKVKQQGQNTVSTNPALAQATNDVQQGGQQPLTAFGLNQTQAQEEWIYSFTVANISAYRLGRTQDAIFQSKPLLPTDAPTDPVNKLSLTVDEEIAPRTSIEYEIALSDHTGGLASEWLPINPSNRVDGISPKVISFGDDTTESYEFTVNSGDITSTDIVTNKAINYYPIYQLPTSGDYRFGSAKLYRGGGVFSRRLNSREVVRSISDNYTDFSDGIRTKQLYSFRTETAAVINRLVGAGNVTKTFLRVPGPITRSIRAVRDELSDPPSGLDPEPDYAVGKIEHIRPTMVVENDAITPTGTDVIVNGVSIPVAGSWMGSTTNTASIGVPIIRNGQPVDIKPTTVELKYVSTSSSLVHTFQEGVDYSVKRSDDSYFQNFAGWNSQPLHWRIVPVEPSSIQINSGSPLTGQYGGTGSFSVSFGQLPPVTLGSESLASNASLNISYEIDSNITHRVVDVSYSSSEVELDGLIQVQPGDTILVTYRKVPQNIIRDSVRVTSNPGRDNPGTIYNEGADYSLDLVNGTISMSLGGAINKLAAPVAYVDFSFREPVVETQTYSVWCYFDSREPLKFSYNSLNLRVGSGEQLLWTTNGDTKRIDDKKDFTLTRGWHQFTVRSLNPDTFNDAAIIKVLKFRDIDSRYLFLRRDRGGKVFEKITAYRSPMTEVTFTRLKNDILKTNHGHFALDNTNQVMVNFSPAETDELYMKRVTSSGAIESQAKEEFTIEATRRLLTSANDDNPGYIMLRARLSRAENSSGGVTPKLSGYNIRIAY